MDGIPDRSETSAVTSNIVEPARVVPPVYEKLLDRDPVWALGKEKPPFRRTRWSSAD
jgi:hypothetical protein